MSSIGGISSFSNGLSLGAIRRARRPQKTSTASGLHAEGEKDAHLPQPAAQDEADSTLDHSGTDDAVPFRHADPNPFFVAQLLGQLLPSPEQTKSSGAIAAYKEIALRLKLYDRIL
jgi:hypothetical protein